MMVDWFHGGHDFMVLSEQHTYRLPLDLTVCSAVGWFGQMIFQLGVLFGATVHRKKSGQPPGMYKTL